MIRRATQRLMASLSAVFACWRRARGHRPARRARLHRDARATCEIGIRMALGGCAATSSSLVLREVLLVAAGRYRNAGGPVAGTLRAGASSMGRADGPAVLMLKRLAACRWWRCWRA